MTLEADLIDIRELSDEDVLSLKVEDRPIIMYCHRGIRSQKLVLELRENGQNEVFSLRGGAQSL